MHQTLNFFTLIVLVLFSRNAKATLTWDKADLSARIKKAILEDGPYCKSEVKDINPPAKVPGQQLDFQIYGLHKKRCSRALVKLSQYERYAEFVDFIKKSTYDNKKERIRLNLSHTLMPFNMVLDFKIERITSPGTYKFSFDSGFLKGLKGQINISKYKQRCFFATTASWQGPYSGIPNSVFSFFSQALGEIAMERLFRISETL
jgi:hypothetical protein